MLRSFRKSRKVSHKAAKRWPESGLPPPSVRRFTLDAWQRAKQDMMAKKLHTNIATKPLFASWIVLGRVLDQRESDFQDSGETMERDFGPLERCARQECACSVFQPTHSLRLCTGCWSVAYCNGRCQEE